MKKYGIILVAGLIFIGCKKEAKEDNLKNYAVFGDTISNENVMSASEMAGKYENLKEGDTLKVKFESKINSVCKVKGCWMNLELGDGKEIFVKFKDYAFFVPKNANGSEAIVSGKAFVSEETVAEQKHYAQDAGASEEEIEKIVSPKRKLSFLADGVLIKK
ncbi:DUF4920 domain-containing protein [Flavobacterium sp. H122]|uniref:DUF4920 domain-containing protein n=1 Tax=Flavobacterium sp. H122 TaxID=2529860 RepID=UPI0010AA49FE|nr:DUF4920 domain-containing protein [Flavobacterium sp. H122]